MDSETHRFSAAEETEARGTGTPTGRLSPTPFTETNGHGPYPSQNVAPRPVAPAMFGGNSWLAWVLIGMGLLFFLQPFRLSTVVGQSVVLVIGAILLYVYFQQQRGNVGFLIPGCILTGLGAGIVAQALTYQDGLVPLGLGLGFCAIWYFQRAFWWALIPGGIITLSGLQETLRYGNFLSNFGVDWALRGDGFWALLLIGLGVWLFASRRRSTRPQ